MTLLSIIALVLILANLVWGAQTRFNGGWPFWVNFVGAILLALIQFTALL